MRQEYFDRYTDSVYGRANIFSPEELERSAVEVAHVDKDLLPKDKSLPVLEIGCGDGSFLYFLKKSGYTDIHGIDISSQQIELCRRHVTDKVECADALDFLKGKENCYAMVVAHDMLEHIVKERALP